MRDVTGPTAAPHYHKHFYRLETVKNSFEVQKDGLYRMVEYSYAICTGCGLVQKRETKVDKETT